MANIHEEGNTFYVELDDGIFYIPINESHRLIFEKMHGNGSLIKLYHLLTKNCNTFTDTGKEFGLTKQRISQIYKKRLAPYLPQKNGRGRQRQCNITRVHLAEFPKATLAVWREARRNGIEVNYINSIRSSGGIFTLRTSLMLNGNRCKISSISNQFSPSGTNRIYARLDLRINILRKSKFLICVLYINKSEKRFFIVTTADMINVTSGRKKSGCFYVPYQILPVYNNNKPNLDWPSYLNAWHLLK